MNCRLPAALMAAALIFGCGAGEEPAIREGSLAGLVPDVSSMDGWRIADGPTEHDSESLYEYLNGGAPLYLKYGFRGMVHVRYQLRDDSLSSVTLDVYDMESEVGAFGLHRSGRPEDAEVRDWGAEGYRSGIVAAAWRGSFAIHAEADIDDPELIGAMEAMVADVAAGVAGTTSPPAIIDMLPRDGLVPWSERIVAEDMMSHAFLPGGVLASYQVDGLDGKLFFSELPTEAAAADAMVELRAHHQQWGEVVADIDSIGDGGFRFSDPGLGPGAVISSGSFVVGVHGDLPLEFQDDLLGHLVANLEGID